MPTYQNSYLSWWKKSRINTFLLTWLEHFRALSSNYVICHCSCCSSNTLSSNILETSSRREATLRCHYANATNTASALIANTDISCNLVTCNHDSFKQNISRNEVRTIASSRNCRAFNLTNNYSLMLNFFHINSCCY